MTSKSSKVELVLPLEALWIEDIMLLFLHYQRLVKESVRREILSLGLDHLL